jgi:S-adenosylmethionine decarboxylase
MGVESIGFEEAAQKVRRSTEPETLAVREGLMLGQELAEEGEPPSVLGLVRAGIHLIADLWGASRLDDVAAVEEALRLAVDAAGAKLLYIYMHHFGPNAGVSGVAVLGESHISIHTWPERNYAALDAFMCGRCDPRRTLPVMERVFQPKQMVVQVYLRGANPKKSRV